MTTASVTRQIPRQVLSRLLLQTGLPIESVFHGIIESYYWPVFERYGHMGMPEGGFRDRT